MKKSKMSSIQHPAVLFFVYCVHLECYKHSKDVLNGDKLGETKPFFQSIRFSVFFFKVAQTAVHPS